MSKPKKYANKNATSFLESLCDDFSPEYGSVGLSICLKEFIYRHTELRPDRIIWGKANKVKTKVVGIKAVFLGEEKTITFDISFGIENLYRTFTPNKDGNGDANVLSLALVPTLTISNEKWGVIKL